MSFKTLVFTERSPTFSTEAVAHVRARVSHEAAPDVFLGEAISGPIGIFATTYFYIGCRYNRGQFKRLERKLHRDVLEEALAQAKRNLSRLQSIKL